MPTYTYRCNTCGHEFEQRQRMIDDPLTECPVCEGEIRRVINSVGIVFKGSGFYVTDNRNGNKNGKAKASKKASTDETSGDSSNKESSNSKDDSTSKSSESSESKKPTKAKATKSD